MKKRTTITVTKILASLLVVLFCFGGHVLIAIYPDLETDYDVFLKYYYARERLNEVMMCLLFFVAYINTIKLAKAILFFGFSLAFASVIDKVFLDNYKLLYSDIVIIGLALLLSYRVYKNGKNTSRS